MTPEQKQRLDFCRTQLERCDSLDLWNTVSDAGKRELLRALVESTVDGAHAKVVIDTWLKRSPKRPTPFDLHAIADETRPEEKLPEGCGACHGDVWIVTAAGAARCDCARGRYLREKDAENARRAAS